MAARLEPSVFPQSARRSPVPAAVAICVALGALVPGLGGCRRGGTDGDAIRSLVDKEVAAINARDVTALSEIWSKEKDALLFDVPPPGRFQGWNEIGPLWKGFFDKVSEVHLSVDAVRATSDGTLGYATYDWTMTGRLGSYALDDRGEATAIYRKEGGQWRLVHAHFSPAPPALAGGAARGAESPAAGAGATSVPAPGAGPGEGAGPAGSGKPAASGGKPAGGQAGPDARPTGTPTPGPTAGRPGTTP